MYQDELRNNKIGSAIPHLNKELFFNLIFPFAPIEEQKRIVEIIDKLESIPGFNVSLEEDFKMTKIYYDILDSFGNLYKLCSEFYHNEDRELIMLYVSDDKFKTIVDKIKSNNSTKDAIFALDNNSK